MRASLMGLPHLEHGSIPISARLNIGLGWTDDMLLASIGREHASLSVTDNCRYGGGDRITLLQLSSDSAVKIAHFQRDLSDH
jgi:hypothetical protein